VQTTEYQAEAVQRLRLPFPLLSDADQRMSTGLRLPTFQVDGEDLLRRFTLVVHNG
jgi:peroxiredoxin